MEAAAQLGHLLRVAAHDLDAVGVDLVRIVELEVDIFDDERPDVVAEAVCVEVTLERGGSVVIFNPA